MRCPTRVEYTVDKNQAGTLLMLLRVENNRRSITLSSAPRIGRLNFDRSTELLATSRKIQGVQPLMIGSAAGLGHGHNIDRAVRTHLQVDCRRRRNPDFGRDLLATPVI